MTICYTFLVVESVQSIFFLTSTELLFRRPSMEFSYFITEQKHSVHNQECVPMNYSPLVLFNTHMYMLCEPRGSPLFRLCDLTLCNVARVTCLYTENALLYWCHIHHLGLLDKTLWNITVNLWIGKILVMDHLQELFHLMRKLWRQSELILVLIW